MIFTDVILIFQDSAIHYFQREKEGSFYPESVQRRVLPTRYVDMNGDSVELEPTYSHPGNSEDFVEGVMKENMCFLDTSYFIAGNIH